MVLLVLFQKGHPNPSKNAFERAEHNRCVHGMKDNWGFPLALLKKDMAPLPKDRRRDRAGGRRPGYRWGLVALLEGECEKDR